ncbi:MAG TPA: hypothetical protein VI111_09865 [Thermoleophilaceae bacterium]
MGTFGTVLIAISVLAVLAAAASYWGAGGMYRRIGRDGLDMRREPSVASADPAEAQEEIRQLLEAKSARREARGEEPLDVEAELASLSTAPAPADAGLRAEVRQLVIARNERLLRQGREPLDVEAEVERQLRDLNG